MDECKVGIELSRARILAVDLTKMAIAASVCGRGSR